MGKSVQLQSVGYLEGDGKDVSTEVFDRPVMLVYAGQFDSMDGPVEITANHIERIASEHNSLLSKMKNLLTGDIPMRHYPPVQLDHSTSAAHTIGRLVGDLAVGKAMIEGEEKVALFGTARFLGRDNVEKAKDGRYTHVSIGADLESCKLNELSVTPFPAAPHASLLSKSKAEISAAVQVARGIYSKVSSHAPSVESDSEGIVSLFFETEKEASSAAQLLKGTGKFKSVVKDGDAVHAYLSRHYHLAEHNGVKYEVREVEPGEFDIVVEGKVVTHHAGSAEEVDREAQRYIDHEKKEVGMHEKLKKHLMEHRKMSEQDAEKLSAEVVKHHMGKMNKSDEDMKKHMASADDAECKRMAEEHDEHLKHLAAEADKEKQRLKDEEEKKESEKKLSAARASVVTLSKGIKAAITGLSSEIRMAGIQHRVAKLRSAGKITPAEIKKLDVVKLASLSQEAVEAALGAFEILEPRVDFGAVSGTTKADIVSVVAKKFRMARLELETRLNMPSKKAEAEALLTKLSEEERKEMAAARADAGEPSKGVLTKVSYDDLCKMLEDKEKHEDLKKHLKHLVDIHGSEGDAHGGEEEGKRMSALAKSQTELQNRFEELVSAVAPALGIKPEELKQ
jgi:hypothetical protein